MTADVADVADVADAADVADVADVCRWRSFTWSCSVSLKLTTADTAKVLHRVGWGVS